MILDVYCNDGSPLNVTPDMIWGRGVGGAELALMTWAETMARHGHQVRIYNQTQLRNGMYGRIKYLPQKSFDPAQPRDIFIAFRSVNPFLTTVNANMKIFWSCDQHTTGNYKTEIFPFVDRIVCISPFHVDYHKRTYGPVPEDKIGYFDLGVRIEDYNRNIEKVSGRCIYCSVPDRGLDELLNMWPQIKERVPYASLVITSDYTLWGSPTPNNQQHRLKWAGMPDVEFLGNIPRERLIEEQLKAVCQPYPCTYEELFCIATAECQVAGAYPVTTDKGALITTNMASLVHTTEWFLEEVEHTLNNDGYWLKKDKQNTAKARFNWNVICLKWEHLFNTGEFI